MGEFYRDLRNGHKMVRNLSGDNKKVENLDFFLCWMLKKKKLERDYDEISISQW